MGTIARGWAVEQLGDVRGAVVWDLYGGIGDTAVALAERGAQVVSVDADEKARSEEHTSELQSQSNLVCRLLLEKKKNTRRNTTRSQSPRGTNDDGRRSSSNSMALLCSAQW